jgi:hypothetical protein
MSSQTISWHEQCLKNSKITEKKWSDQLKKDHDSLLKLRLDNIFLEEQIINAINKGKKSFDSTKFMRKRKAVGK